MRWSQEDLAEFMNVSKNTIHDIETGRKFVRAQRLIQLSELFNIEVFKLFLPQKIKSIDSSRIVSQFAKQVRESLENLKYDFIRKNK